MATKLVDLGKKKMIAALSGSVTQPKYIGWGSGSGTTGDADTTLFDEESEARVTGAVTTETTNVTDDTYKVVGTITAEGTKTITNAGVFDAATNGELFIKGDFTGIPLNTGDSIEFTIKNVQTTA